MVMRDKIIQVIKNKVSDGEGGFISNSPDSQVEIECKASLNVSPEVMNAYGQGGEQVLHIISRGPLLEEAIYLFNGKKYNVRVQTNNRRLFYSTLVEIK